METQRCLAPYHVARRPQIPHDAAGFALSHARVVVIGAGLAGLAVACLSPTLPLPPPERPMVTGTETAGLVRLSGAVEPQSEVFALNHNNNLISGEYTESGAYDFTLQAEERDWVSLWYVHETEASPATDFVVKIPPVVP